MNKTIVAIFENRENAEKASREVSEKGLRYQDISIAALDSSNSGVASNDNISDGTITGSAVGGVAGAMLGLGLIAVPGLGVIAAAGPIAGALTGVATGGIIGSLVDLGFSEESSAEYENDIKSGKTLWSIQTSEDDAGNVAKILRSNGAVRVELHNR